MKVKINNKETDIEAANLQQLSEEIQLPVKGVAVAINNKMIPRSEWESATITEDANIVIIKAACGG